MDNEEIVKLTEKYIAGNCSQEETVLLENWYLQWAPDVLHVDVQELIQAKLDVMNRLPVDFNKKPAVKKLWPRIVVAAAAIAAIVFGIWFYTNTTGRLVGSLVTGDFSVSNVAPGKQGATLTLANGEKIRLSDAVDGELAKESGIRISKTANGQLVYEMASRAEAVPSYHTLTTAKGETYQLRLPDGSLVWLNAASSITYRAALIERGERSVELDGEAYFEVAKDKVHPFVVVSKKQRVEVLGTHFNINTYPDESTAKTTLIEGAVKISSIPGGEAPTATILKPAQQAVLNSSGQLSVKNVNTDDAISWKNGDFVFNNEDFKITMRKIARWYDVEIVYDASVPENIELAGWISRKGSLSTVLERIAQAGKLHFKVEGRRVTATR